MGSHGTASDRLQATASSPALKLPWQVSAANVSFVWLPAGLLHPADTVMDINIGAALWLAARAEGRLRMWGPTAHPLASSKSECAHLQTPWLGVQPVTRPQGQTPVSPNAKPAASISDCSRDTGDAGLGSKGHSAATNAAVSRGEKVPGLWQSKARVVLLGQGADEQCAGYGRHRTHFREGVSRQLPPLPPHAH